MFASIKAADAFTGLTDETPGKILGALKAAAPFLGIRPILIHAVDWLFKFTKPVDWQRGSRPIVWPSAAEQEEAFGLGSAQVKQLNRQLAELGLVTMRDSPNGKRFGHRLNGHIVEAYGFDLSPLAARLEEFRAIAEENNARRKRFATLRRRATVARNGLRQVFLAAEAEAEAETEAETEAKTVAAFDVVAWKRRLSELSQGVAAITDETILIFRVAALERLKAEAQDAVWRGFDEQDLPPQPVETDPRGLENQPHMTSTNESLNPSDTVFAAKNSSRWLEYPSHAAQAPLPARTETAALTGDTTGKVRPSNPVMNISAAELVSLAPPIRAYLRQASPIWPDIVDAVGWLTGTLGIPQPLWGEACLTLGREGAATAVAILCAKPEGYFRVSPAAYFAGMIKRAKEGALDLNRSLWGLRMRTSAKERPVSDGLCLPWQAQT
jgi:replication initiation protein RepC